MCGRSVCIAPYFLGIEFGFDKFSYNTTEKIGSVMYSVVVKSGELGREITLVVNDTSGSATR